MNITSTKKEYQKLTVKELAVKLNISERSASDLRKDIKQERGIKIVTWAHVADYLKIPTAQNVS